MRTQHVILSAMVLLLLLGCISCTNPISAAIEESFRDSIPEIAERCEQILSQQMSEPMPETYLAGKVLLIKSYTQRYMDLCYVSPSGRGPMWDGPYTRSLLKWDKDWADLFLAMEDHELRTVVWVTRDYQEAGWVYQNGRVAWKCVSDVWLIDLQEESVCGHKVFEGFPGPVYRSFSDAYGDCPQSEVTDWLLEVTLWAE